MNASTSYEKLSAEDVQIIQRNRRVIHRNRTVFGLNDGLGKIRLVNYRDSNPSRLDFEALVLNDSEFRRYFPSWIQLHNEAMKVHEWVRSRFGGKIRVLYEEGCYLVELR